MNRKLLKILRCPKCKQRLSLKEEKRRKEEVLSGKLVCSCGKTYNIAGGVPCMVPGLNKIDGKTQKTFSKQWSYYKYGKTKSWGRSPEKRKGMLLGYMGLSKRSIKGRKIIDAACGSAELTMKLAGLGFGMVVGMDFSDIVFQAYKNNRYKEMVFIVQGDVLNPPFAEDTFDYVHSAGTIMHTSDARRAFRELSRLAKKKFWVWFYLKRNLVKKKHRNWTIIVHHIVRNMPLKIQNLVLDYLAYPIVTIAQYLGLLRMDSPNERKILLRDSFTPHETYYTPQEVERWFREEGYTKIEVTDRTQSDGLGILGVKYGS